MSAASAPRPSRPALRAMRMALDARTGRHLWHYYMGQMLTASPMTYLVDGKQYVAVASATAVFAFGLVEPAAARKDGN